MLTGIYSRGSVSKTVCVRDRFKSFLQHCRRNGYHLSFIESPKVGVIIPSHSQKLQSIVDSGDLVVLKSKRSPNIIVAGKHGRLRNSVTDVDLMVSINDNHLGDMYEYHVVHISNMKPPIPATASARGNKPQ